MPADSHRVASRTQPGAQKRNPDRLLYAPTATGRPDSCRLLNRFTGAITAPSTYASGVTPGSDATGNDGLPGVRWTDWLPDPSPSAPSPRHLPWRERGGGAQPWSASNIFNVTAALGGYVSRIATRLTTKPLQRAPKLPSSMAKGWLPVRPSAPRVAPQLGATPPPRSPGRSLP